MNATNAHADSAAGSDAQRWLRAVTEPEVRDSLEYVYSTVADRIAARGPSCWASGRCCNFDAAGHRLYVTGLEAAYTLTLLPTDRPIDQCAIDEAIVRGGCPFQVVNLCGVHTIKPLGCRVYFCDRSAQLWQQNLTEDMLSRIRLIHDAHDIPYRYGEWRSMLAAVVAARC